MPDDAAPTPRATVGPAQAEDLPAVRDIYNHYVRTSTVTFDEECLSLERWHQRLDELRAGSLPFLVARVPGGELVGYAMVTPWKPKRAYRFTVENSIYLAPGAIGTGLGRRLLVALLEEARDAGIREVIAVLADVGAEASTRLHASLGFVEVGRLSRVGFKFGRWLGVAILQKSLR